MCVIRPKQAQMCNFGTHPNQRADYSNYLKNSPRTSTSKLMHYKVTATQDWEEWPETSDHQFAYLLVCVAWGYCEKVFVH